MESFRSERSCYISTFHPDDVVSARLFSDIALNLRERELTSLHFQQFIAVILLPNDIHVTRLGSVAEYHVSASRL